MTCILTSLLPYDQQAWDEGAGVEFERTLNREILMGRTMEWKVMRDVLGTFDAMMMDGGTQVRPPGLFRPAVLYNYLRLKELQREQRTRGHHMIIVPLVDQEHDAILAVYFAAVLVHVDCLMGIEPPDVPPIAFSLPPICRAKLILISNVLDLCNDKVEDVNYLCVCETPR